MRPTDLIPVEIADLLSQMCAADHGHSDATPSPQQGTELADSLGCPKEARASAWEAWSSEPNPTDWGAAEDWLDVAFIEPCPQARAV